jgi:hypothetical protein
MLPYRETQRLLLFFVIVSDPGKSEYPRTYHSSLYLRDASMHIASMQENKNSPTIYQIHSVHNEDADPKFTAPSSRNQKVTSRCCDTSVFLICGLFRSCCSRNHLSSRFDLYRFLPPLLVGHILACSNKSENGRSLCRVALQISSNPNNEASLTDLTISMGVPDEVIGGSP